MPDRLPTSASPSPGTTLTLEIAADFAAVRNAGIAMRDWLSRHDVPAEDIDRLILATIEAGNNAVEHADPSASGLPVRFDFCLQADWIEIRVTDHTPGFDWPAEVRLPDPESEGGRGLFLITSLMDDVAYFRGRNQNHLLMRKRRPSGPGRPAPTESDLAAQLAEAEDALDAMTVELASTYESLTALFRYSAELGRGAKVQDFATRLLGDLVQITEADVALLRLLSADGRRLETFLVWPEAADLAGGSDRSEAAGKQGGGAPARLPPLAFPAQDPAGVELEAAQTRQDVWFGSQRPLAPTDPLCNLSGLESGLCHPFIASTQLIGTAVLGRRTRERAFTAAQVSLLHTFTDFLGLHLAYARLQDERTRIRVLERELQIAADIQRSLLPAELPDCPPFSLAASCVSAREVGGDFHDVIAAGIGGSVLVIANVAAKGQSMFAPGGLLLVIADVMGKGVPAALFAAMLRNAIRSMPHLFTQPGRLLETVNQTLFADLSRVDMFATAKVVFADRAQRVLLAASAGHSPLLVASPSRAPHAVDDAGLPLGIDPNATYGETRAVLEPGDCALLYTDGVTEARDPAGALFGEQRLIEWFSEAAAVVQPVESMKASLLERLDAYCKGASAADDRTFILVRHS